MSQTSSATYAPADCQEQLLSTTPRFNALSVVAGILLVIALLLLSLSDAGFDAAENVAHRFVVYASAAAAVVMIVAATYGMVGSRFSPRAAVLTGLHAAIIAILSAHLCVVFAALSGAGMAKDGGYHVATLVVMLLALLAMNALFRMHIRQHIVEKQGMLSAGGTYWPSQARGGWKAQLVRKLNATRHRISGQRVLNEDAARSIEDFAGTYEFPKLLAKAGTRVNREKQMRMPAAELGVHGGAVFMPAAATAAAIPAPASVSDNPPPTVDQLMAQLDEIQPEGGQGGTFGSASSTGGHAAQVASGSYGPPPGSHGSTMPPPSHPPPSMAGSAVGSDEEDGPPVAVGPPLPPPAHLNPAAQAGQDDLSDLLGNYEVLPAAQPAVLPAAEPDAAAAAAGDGPYAGNEFEGLGNAGDAATDDGEEY